MSLQRHMVPEGLMCKNYKKGRLTVTLLSAAQPLKGMQLSSHTIALALAMTAFAVLQDMGVREQYSSVVF